jgi:hypothetical protein
MKIITLITIATLIFFAFSSCKRENDLTIKNDSTQSYSVKASQVKEIAEHFSFFSNRKSNSSLSGNNKSATVKRIKELKAILTTKNDTALFIVNYENAGFIIVSGDKRLQPILAYSPTGSFPIDFSLCPPAAIEWLTFKKNQIERFKISKKINDPVTEANWNNLITPQVIDPIDPPPTCSDEQLNYGPLLYTSWGQGMYYNEYIPGLSECTHATVGCVSVAMAQIMKYYNYPIDNIHNFYWNIMPPNLNVWNNGIYEVARLMKCINDSLAPVYGCEQTLASHAKIVPLLTNGFDFSTATNASYDFNTVKNEILANRPVMLIGGESERHVWICDGYVYSKYCVYYNGNWVGINEFHYLHMNWGWAGECDGLYSPDNFNPLEVTILGNIQHDFNYEKEMIYNIVPSN